MQISNAMYKRGNLLKELQTLFKPESEYNYEAHNYRSSPWVQIYNARHMEIDTTQYQTNRTYYSKLYKSMTGAGIQHNDILSIWGNPYINTATGWNGLSYSKQQSIRTQYPGIDDVAKSISSIKYDFANVLSKTTPEMRRFVNDFAIPVTTISSMYKGSPSLLSKSSDAITSCLYKIADGFNRMMIPGYAAYADGGSVEEIITSAGSDLILTYCGGKAIKLSYQGLKYAGAKFSSVLKPKTTKITWGLWEDLPKTTYKGQEYAKIGKYYYSRHAVEHMRYGAIDAVIPPFKSGGKGIEMRRIPSMVVEEVIKYGKKSKTFRDGDWRWQYVLGDMKVFTSLDSKAVVSLRKETMKK